MTDNIPNTPHACHNDHHYHQGLPENATIDEKLFFNMRNCAHIMRLNADGKGGQRRILSILRQREHLTQRELMDIVDVSSATLSEVLGKIEAHGFIQRNRSDEDKRNIDIQLTESGALEADQAELNRTDSDSELFSGLSADEKATLVGLLEKLSADWQSRALNCSRATRVVRAAHTVETDEAVMASPTDEADEAVTAARTTSNIPIWL